MKRRMRYLSRFTTRRSGVIASTNNPDRNTNTKTREDTAIGLRAVASWLVLFWLTVINAPAYGLAFCDTQPGAKTAPGYPLVYRYSVNYDRIIEEDHVLLRLAPARYLPVIRIASLRYGVPSPLIAALIAQETNGTWSSSLVVTNPNGTTDTGLAQANSRYLEYFKERFDLIDPYNAEDSILFVARYLRYMYNRTKNWHMAVIRYKRGLNGFVDMVVVRVADEIIEEAGLCLTLRLKPNAPQ